MDIEQFANHCCFCLNGSVLTTSCHFRDNTTGKMYKFERRVDLKPAVDYVARQLHAWHLNQHGPGPTVGGWTDYVKTAVHTVKKVAQSKTVQSLYHQAAPFLKSAVRDLPGGETAMEIAGKAADVYTQAKKGSQQALAKVHKLKQMAQAGSSQAQFAVRVMQNVGHIISEKLGGNPHPVLPAVANALQKHQGSLYHTGVTAVSGTDIVGLSWSDAKWAVPGYAAYRGAKALAPKHKKRSRPVVDHRAHATAASRQAAQAHLAPQGPVMAPLAAQMVAPTPTDQTPTLPSEQYAEEELYEEAVDGEFQDDGSDADVSGWKWNHPYRTTPQMVVQSPKSPGVAMAARELYNRGMGRPPTDLSQLAQAALAEF